MILSQSSHCALIIVMELAIHYDLKGVSLREISERHYIPLDVLKPITKRLCDIGIVCCEQGEDKDLNWLFLKTNPSETSVYDIIVQFDGDIFSGRFLNPETGKLLPKSTLSHIINLERKEMIKYMRRRLKKINIGYWGEVAGNKSQFEYKGL